MANVIFYSSAGEELAWHHVDSDSFALTRRGSVTLPANVQYAWPHPSRQFLYVVTSNGGPGGMRGDTHHLNALRIGADGALQKHGEPQPLPSRPIHVTVDGTGRFALTAFNLPSGITVHRINADGSAGAPVVQPGSLDTGTFAHQVMLMPSGKTAILVTRGNDAEAGKPEDPGALKLFRFKEGVLENLVSIAPGGGFGYGPRHLDFHPTQPWAYVSIERQNKLLMYRVAGDALEPEAAFNRDLLEDPLNERPRQLGGAVHVHPNGRTVYVANRSFHEVAVGGVQVFGGGENNIAVFSIDPKTGEPSLIQHIDTHSLHMRTFSLEPSGRMLVGASILPLAVREGSGLRTVPPALTVFRVGDDGKLEFVRKYDVETGGRSQFWSGMVGVRNPRS